VSGEPGPDLASGEPTTSPPLSNQGETPRPARARPLPDPHTCRPLRPSSSPSSGCSTSGSSVSLAPRSPRRWPSASSSRAGDRSHTESDHGSRALHRDRGGRRDCLGGEPARLHAGVTSGAVPGRQRRDSGTLCVVLGQRSWLCRAHPVLRPHAAASPHAYRQVVVDPPHPAGTLLEMTVDMSVLERLPWGQFTTVGFAATGVALSLRARAPDIAVSALAGAPEPARGLL